MAFSQDVLLGYVGRQLGPEELDVRLSRFGGTPVWSKEPSSESMLRRPDFFNCRLCGKPLVLFTQIAAGYGDRPKRLLHVFTCRASECSSDPLSWRVLRSTGKLATEAAEDLGHHHHRDPQSQGSGYPTPSATGDDWSVAADDWSQPGCPASAKAVAEDDWGAAKAADDWSQPGASATAADDEIEALLAQRSTSAPVAKVPALPAKAKKAPLEAEEAAWQGVVANVGREDPLPCLSITIDYEPAPEEAAGEHEHELLQRYLHSELAEGEVDQMIASGALPKELQAEVESLRQEAQQEVTNDSEVAYGEDDDDDDDVEEAILSSGGTSVNWLRRFQQRLSRSPEQVIRYCWGGEPLWLHAPPTSKLPKCVCGASRCFELQLLPTLHAQLSQAVPSAKLKALGMEWGSVIIFTCSKDCLCEDPCEELLVVQPSV